MKVKMLETIQQNHLNHLRRTKGLLFEDFEK